MSTSATASARARISPALGCAGAPSRADGAYLRFAGNLRIEQYKGEQLVESYVDDALWELMYLGKAPP